ncbi:unnamed protein product [Rhizophagus irregularis]|nr:unnamed protein product [Rhizophagus irregularis]
MPGSGELSVCRGDRLAEVQVKKPYLTLRCLTILYSQSVAALCLDFLKLGSIEKLEIVVRISCRIFIYVSRNIILNTSSSFVSITGSFGVEDSTGMAGM